MADLDKYVQVRNIELLASNFTSPNDVWNSLSQEVILTGSMGKQIKDNLDKPVSKTLTTSKFIGLK